MAPRITAHLATISIAAAILTTTACSDGRQGTFVGGAVSSPTAALSLRMTPTNLALIPLSSAGCPQTQPFMTNVTLVLGPMPPEDFFFDRLTFAFLDGFGRRSTLFFSTVELGRFFNDRRILGGTHRSFLLQPRFGCGLSRPRSLEAIIGLVDGRGLLHESTATATFE